MMLALMPLYSFTQDTNLPNEPFHLDVKLHEGFLIAHRPIVGILQNKHIQALEFSIIKQLSGKKPWERIHNLPESGMSAMYFNLSDSKKLGYAISLFPVINFRFGDLDRSSFHCKIGAGIGYIEQAFNKKTNYKNQAIGSEFNGFMHVSLYYKRMLSENISFSSGISVSHFSNGSIKTPNLGINLPSLHVGLSYMIDELHCEPNNLEVATNVSKNNSIGIIGGIRQRYPVDGDYYAVGGLSYLREWFVSGKSNVGVQAELMYDSSIKPSLDDVNTSFSEQVNYRSGIAASYVFKLNRLNILIQMGAYLYALHNEDGPLYHRFGTRYHLRNNVLALVNLKTHYAKADYFEFGFGYKW